MRGENKGEGKDGMFEGKTLKNSSRRGEGLFEGENRQKPSRRRSASSAGKRS